MSSVVAIVDRLYLEILIQGQSLPETPNLMHTLSIHESVNAMTPVCQFTFNDTISSMVRDLALTEGTQMNVLVGKYKESAVPRKFRFFGSKQTSTREGPKIVANFILDAPEYISGSYTEAFEGTSSDVMAQLASKCNLKSNVTETTDSMVWLNFGQTRAAFAEDIAIHGYTGEANCMYRALSSESVLIYKDAFKELNSTKPVRTLALNTSEGDEIIQIRDIRDVSVSGVMNSWLNYGWKFPEHSLKGKEILNEKYDVQTTESYLPINSDVKSQIGDQSRVEYCTKLDCRNAHDNYNKAYYNNLRGRALLGERLHILIEEPSGIQLLDIIEFRHNETDGHTGKGTGKYIVTAKVIYITNGSAYYEKLEICRAALREAGNTPLVG